MHRSSIYVAAAIAAIAVMQRLSLGADEAPRSIPDIMRAAHIKGGRVGKQTLDLRVISGRATDDEKKRLLEMYETLASLKPPAGSLEGWKKDTAILVEAARDTVKGKADAAERLRVATKCAACHDKYRFGRVFTADQSVFVKAAPPELVQVAGMHPRESYVIVYSLKITDASKFETQVVEREVVVDGRKTVVKETVKVPVIQKKREVVESTLSVKPTPGLAGSPNFRVLDPSGKEVSGEDLWERLKPGQMVLRQPTSDPPDLAYLRLLAPDTLIFVPRRPDPPPPSKRANSEGT